MPRKKKIPELDFPPTVALKILALRDDPLVHKHRELYEQLFWNKSSLYWPTSPSEKDLLNRLWKLDVQISKKYNLPASETALPKLAFNPDWTTRASEPALLHHAVQVGTTWRSEMNNAFSNSFSESPPPPFPEDPSSPGLTIKMDLTKIHPKRLGWYVEWFKDTLQIALKEQPHAYCEGPTIESKNVMRDYQRYRLHILQHVSFRWIAAMEKTGVTKDDQKPLKGISVPKESSVRESVCRVYKILFGKLYRARLHRYERRHARMARTLETFKCPRHDHKNDCPHDCRYAKDWMKKNNKL